MLELGTSSFFLNIKRIIKVGKNMKFKFLFISLAFACSCLGCSKGGNNVLSSQNNEETYFIEYEQLEENKKVSFAHAEEFQYLDNVISDLKFLANHEVVKVKKENNSLSYSLTNNGDYVYVKGVIDAPPSEPLPTTYYFDVLADEENGFPKKGRLNADISKIVCHDMYSYSLTFLDNLVKEVYYQFLKSDIETMRIENLEARKPQYYIQPLAVYTFNPGETEVARKEKFSCALPEEVTLNDVTYRRNDSLNDGYKFEFLSNDLFYGYLFNKKNKDEASPYINTGYKVFYDETNSISYAGSPVSAISIYQVSDKTIEKRIRLAWNQFMYYIYEAI